MAFDGRESVQLLGVSQVPYSGPGLCRTLTLRLAKSGESAFECLKENSAKTPANTPRCHVPLMLLVGGEGFKQL